MNGARDRLAAWWLARDPRERRMLAVMCLALVAFTAWYGVTTPLRTLRDDARTRHAQAAAELVATRQAAAEIEALLAARPSPPNVETLESTVLETARAAGVAISRHRADGAEAIQVEIESVTTPALLAWLDRLRLDHGVAPGLLEITGANGALRVQARFVAIGAAP
ncbi:type II secretion system protein GspM [Lysobacter sp. A3-1-A15]|uniref:type II secretion system protein GspM n=1 Tax=Novilysobacter viscosus TaxID=3098602 RepID=UPI002EDA8D85